MIPLKINWQGLSNLNFSACCHRRPVTAQAHPDGHHIRRTSPSVFLQGSQPGTHRDERFCAGPAEGRDRNSGNLGPIESYKVVSERNLFGTTDRILAAKLAAAAGAHGASGYYVNAGGPGNRCR